MMLTDPHILAKLGHILKRYEPLRYEKIADIPVEICETTEYLGREPEGKSGLEWRPAPVGTRWGGPWITAWLRGDFTTPRNAAGRSLYLRLVVNGPWSKTGCREALVFVNGSALGAIDGQHGVVHLNGAAKGKTHVACEIYSGHDYPGHIELDYKGHQYAKHCHTFDGLELLAEREDVTGFIFDLTVLLDLVKTLDANSLRRGKLLAGLDRVWQALSAMPEETPESEWRPALAEARRRMKPLLAARNGDSAPRIGAIGHSHLDTIWLWTFAETVRKAARTFSTQLNLMERYPEFVFLQSAPCHLEMLRETYPDIFERVCKRVKSGQWEPNGAMWVESDLMCAGAEPLARQFLIGQQKTREWFGYTSDTLWLPDDFGFCGALPQLMRLAGVEFFCTQKIRWNDTTKFPYNTFHWHGMDGSSVIAHQTAHNSGNPMPAMLNDQWNDVEGKDTIDRLLLPMGHGDGGGGPTIEMLEIMRRVGDLEGCPRAVYTRLSDFMKGIRDEAGPLAEWHGELYLEAHRGTQTAKAALKRANRQAEIAVRDAEMLATLAALEGGAYPAGHFGNIWKVLLTNHFHDVLPGTSIAEANDQALAQLDWCRDEARAIAGQAMDALSGGRAAAGRVTVFNTLSWPRGGEMPLPGVAKGMAPAGEGVLWQWVESPDGAECLVTAGPLLPPLGAAVVEMQETRAKSSPVGKSPFKVGKTSVETPFVRLRFDSRGRIVSFIDKASGRDIVRKGGCLNIFEIGEDIPYRYDVWEIDRSQEAKMAPDHRLESREVTAEGPLQLRLRSTYSLGRQSKVVQDMVFHATSPRVDFDTVVDWSERRQLFRTVFDLDVLCHTLRSEAQWGFADRPAHSNQPSDRAQFEVCQHRWSDVAEPGFGVALLNDCKYSVHVDNARVGLTLIKGGNQPDTRCDAGRHMFRYALLPHNEPFSVPAVTRPAAEFNTAPVTGPAPAGGDGIASLLTVDAPNVIVETVKWAESGKAFVVRLYEAGKTGGHVTIRFGRPVREVTETNLLEEKQGAMKLRANAVSCFMRAFEIKTLLCHIL